MSSEPTRIPDLPQLEQTAPFAAWLSRHLLVITVIALILLGLALMAIVQGYGFELGRDGLVRPADAPSEVTSQLTTPPSWTADDGNRR